MQCKTLKYLLFALLLVMNFSFYLFGISNDVNSFSGSLTPFSSNNSLEITDSEGTIVSVWYDDPLNDSFILPENRNLNFKSVYSSLNNTSNKPNPINFSNSSIIPLGPSFGSCSSTPFLGYVTCSASLAFLSNSISEGQTKWFKIQTMSSGLYTARLEGPSNTDFDLYVYKCCSDSCKLCHSAGYSSFESCSANVNSGDYIYIAVHAYRGSGSFALRNSVECTQNCDSSSYTTCSSALPLVSGATKSSLCGNQQYFKIDTSKSCYLTWRMTVDSNSDYDLYASWTSNNCPLRVDCSPGLGRGAEEICKSSQRLPAGTYYALVRKFSGSGTYSITPTLTDCCDSRASVACYNNDVYWYDSCGNRESLKEDCGDNSCDSWSANYCKNNDLFRKRTCYDRGCRNNACFSTTRVEEQLVQDCGDSSCTSWSNVCKNNKVYKTRTCTDKGCSNNACFSNTRNEEQLVQDCGTNSTGQWGSNYCKNNDVYRNRTITVRGCENGNCVSRTTLEEQLVQDCGDNSCNSWSQNYCNGTKLIQNRTCTDRGCQSNACYARNRIEYKTIQECGINTTSSWSNYYCKNGNVYRNRTITTGSCSVNKCVNNTRIEEQLVENCQNEGCSEGKCKKIIVSYYNVTERIEINYLGVVIWNVSGDIKETGIEYAYKSDKSDVVRVKSANLYSDNAYAAIIAPKKGSCIVFIRAYAISKTSGKVYYTDWKEVYSVSYCTLTRSADTRSGGSCSSGNCFDARIHLFNMEIDLVELGIEGVKFFTIGSCIDEGILTVGCAFDAGSTVLMIVPASSVQSGAAKFAKFVHLAEAGKLLKGVTSATKLAKLIPKTQATYKGITITVMGSKWIRWIDELQIFKLADNQIVAQYDKLAEWLFRKVQSGKGDDAEKVIKNLHDTNFAKPAIKPSEKQLINEMLDKSLKAGIEPDKVKFMAKSDNNVVRVMEIGDDTRGWQHIYKKHITGEIKNGTLFSEALENATIEIIKESILNTTSKPSRVLVSPSGKKKCLFSNPGQSKNPKFSTYYVLVVVGEVLNDQSSNTIVDKVITSYPINQTIYDNFKCYDK